MFKKLIAFAALTGAGLGVMHYFIGWENFATERGNGDGGTPIRSIDDRTRGGGIMVQPSGDESDGLTVAISGRMRIPHERMWPMPDGSQRPLTKYLLSATDSRPVDRKPDQIELIGVHVQFFDVDASDPNNPVRIEAATLDASSAVIELGKDESGRPSVLEDRDMDLRDVVMSTVASNKLQPITMRMPRLLVRHAGEQGIELNTPDDTTPFEVDLGGDDPMTLEGLGLRASMPSDDAPPGSERVLELHVASRPVLVRGEQRLSAIGPLDFVENMATGIGIVTLKDRVRAAGLIEGSLAAVGGGPDGGGDAQDKSGEKTPAVATGDSIYAVLARRESKSRDANGKAKKTERSAAWTKFQLLGSPARLTGDGVELICERVDAFPSVDGQSYAFTASGSPRIEQAGKDGKIAAVFEADRIHLVRVMQMLNALHRPYGFASGAFGENVRDLVVFEGPSSIDDKARNTLVRAREGIRVIGAKGRDGAAWSVGYGAVTIEQKDLRATGTGGFTILQRNGEDRVLRLGPETVDPDHGFSIDRGGDKPLSVAGHGFLSMHERPDGTRVVQLEAADADVSGSFGDDGTLEAIETLAMTTDQDGNVLALDARGENALFATQVGKDDQASRVTGAASRIRTEGGGRHSVFTGAPTTITREIDNSIVQGERIDLFRRAGGEQIAIVQSGVHSDAAQAHARVTPPPPPAANETDEDTLDESPDPNREPVDLDADRIVFLPRLLPESVLRFHGGGLFRTAPAFDIGIGARARARHIFASGNVHVRQDGELPTVANGSDLILRADGSGGLMLGSGDGQDPATLTRRGEDGRTTIARAEELQLGRGEADGSESMALMPTAGCPPTIEMHAADSATDSGGGMKNTRVIATGRILASRERIDFEGPVEAFELDDDGAVQADGIHVRADELKAHMDAASGGAVRNLDALGHATMWVRGGVLRGDRITVDILTKTAIVWRTEGYAEFRQPNGSLVRGRRLEVNYETMAFSGWDLRLGTP